MTMITVYTDLFRNKISKVRLLHSWNPTIRSDLLSEWPSTVLFSICQLLSIYYLEDIVWRDGRCPKLTRSNIF